MSSRAPTSLVIISKVHAEVTRLVYDAEQIARDGDHDSSITAYMRAGKCAARHRHWQSALWCYKAALELNLLGRDVVANILGLGDRIRTSADWFEYARSLDSNDWPRFGAAGAKIVTHDSGSLVECPGIGVVLELIITDPGTLEAFPDGRFRAMPLAMALLVIRRALWPQAASDPSSKLRAEIEYRGRRVLLRAAGEWSQPI